MHWKIVREINGWVQIESPTFQAFKGSQTPMIIFRQIWREWKELENWIIEMGLHGWIANTEVENWPMMRIMTKAGAKPYLIDIKNKLIWFNKSLMKEN